jgi:RNA chaperone Hfq
MEVNLLDKMLTAYREQRVAVTIMLQNKVRLSGRIKAFDNYVIVLENQSNAVVYRHAVSNVFPSPAAAQPRPAQQRTDQARPAPRTERTAAPASSGKKPQKPAGKAPASPEAGINTGMREGLLRWMQEQKAPK